jgi:hypothetical protein
MQLTQALLLALATVKFAQAIPQDFNANRFGGGNNGGDTGNNNGGDQNNNGGDNGDNGGQDGGNAGDDQNNNNNNQGGGNGGGNTCLDPNNIQSGSASPGEPDAAAGQSDSLTYVAHPVCE